MERLGIAAKRKPAKIIDFAQYIENNRDTNDQISTAKLLLAEIFVGAYHSNRWASKLTEYYSVNSKKNLQATGTTHNNKKMQWD